MCHIGACQERSRACHSIHTCYQNRLKKISRSSKRDLKTLELSTLRISEQHCNSCSHSLSSLSPDSLADQIVGPTPFALQSCGGSNWQTSYLGDTSQAGTTNVYADALLLNISSSGAVSATTNNVVSTLFCAASQL